MSAAGTVTVDFSSPFPLESEQCTLRLEASSDLETWTPLASGSYREVARSSNPADGTTQITVRLTEPLADQPRQSYRGVWETN